MTERADARPSSAWIQFVLCAALVVEYFELNTVYVLLPQLYRQFGDPSEVGWSVTAFSLVGAASVAVGGRIGDVVGYRAVLLVTLAASAVGSLISATAGTLWQLVVGRGIQGTAAMIVPLALGLMRGVVPSPDRQKVATGVLIGAGYSAAGLAPLTAGLLVGAWDWRAPFWVSGGLGVLVVLLALTLPPVRTGSGRWSEIDLAGAALLMPGIVLLLLGITWTASRGVGDPSTLGLLLGSGAVLAGWVLWERRQAAPIVDLTLFRSRGFTVSCLSFVLFALSLAVAIVLSVLAQNPREVGGFGMTPARYGVWALGLVVVGAAANPVGGRLTARLGCRTTLVVGAAAYAAALFAAAAVLVSVVDRPPWLFAVFLLTAPGNGIVNTTLPAFVAESVPADRSGMAAGVQQVVKQAAQAVGQQGVAVLLVAFPLMPSVVAGGAGHPSTAALVLILVVAGVLVSAIVPVARLAPAVRPATPDDAGAHPSDRSASTA